MVCSSNKPTSTCSSSLLFKGVNAISEDLLLNVVEANFKTFFDWAFLNLGAWFDATIDEYTIYSSGFSPATLLPVVDEAYEDGQVWQGMRKDWVWETGCFMDDSAPIEISGLYINNTYYPHSSSGDYFVDYPNGRVVFDTAIDTSSSVELNHSYRNIQIYRASDSPWFSTLQFNSYNPGDLDLQRSEDGNWSIDGIHRVQLPAIVIEPISRSQSRPFEIGSRSLIVQQDIGFYVLAETKNERNKLLDILRLQQDLTMKLYDTNSLAQSGEYPLDYRGDINLSGVMYPDMVQNYYWRKCEIKSVNLFEIESINPEFHQGLARATIEIISN